MNLIITLSVALLLIIALVFVIATIYVNNLKERNWIEIQRKHTPTRVWDPNKDELRTLEGHNESFFI